MTLRNLPTALSVAACAGMLKNLLKWRNVTVCQDDLPEKAFHNSVKFSLQPAPC
jgi:hypothetical protein